MLVAFAIFAVLIALWAFAPREPRAAEDPGGPEPAQSPATERPLTVG
jgi:hypothetical protein